MYQIKYVNTKTFYTVCITPQKLIILTSYDNTRIEIWRTHCVGNRTHMIACLTNDALPNILWELQPGNVSFVTGSEYTKRTFCPANREVKGQTWLLEAACDQVIGLLLLLTLSLSLSCTTHARPTHIAYRVLML